MLDTRKAGRKTRTSHAQVVDELGRAMVAGTYPVGSILPGDAELAAIQARYSNTTMDQLKTGYQIYTQGACVKCHNAKDIYRYDEARWQPIMDNMAMRAKLSDSDKDAVWKYVLAIKAMQGK